MVPLNWTSVVPVNPVPVIVTVVPPAAGPSPGLTVAMLTPVPPLGGPPPGVTGWVVERVVAALGRALSSR